MQWLEGLGLAKWIVGAMIVGFALLIGTALARSVHAIARYGLRNFVRNSLRIENETWRLIGVLAILAAMAAAMYLTPLGP